MISMEPRFGLRDENQEMAEEESWDGHTTADSSSLSSDGDEEPQLQSMTARGVQHLCSELLELKQESDEDFQKNIFSNYSAFLAINKDIEVIQNEVAKMKDRACLQEKLVKQISEQLYSIINLSEDQTNTREAILDETQLMVMESTHFDTLLSEHKLDEALDEYLHQITSEQRALLTHHLALVAKHPRVPAPELQKALRGLHRIGDQHLANQILLQHYHTRIASAISNLQLQSSTNPFYIQEAARFVCSMISRAVRSYSALNQQPPYASELTHWAAQEMKVFSVCFIKYVESISDTSGRLSTAVDALQIGLAYCLLLEKERIYLQPCLVEFVRPCVEEVLEMHVKHLSKVIGMVTSSDTWVLGRYNVSGILTGRSCEVVHQLPECFFLTNSGRKFVTLFQSVVEEISPLLTFEMESSVLKAMTELFTAYVGILESAITGDEEEEFSINLPQTPTQGVSILASLSALMQFVLSIINNMFDGLQHLDSEIQNHAAVVQDIYTRLKSCFLANFISNIFSPNADRESSTGMVTGKGDISRYCDFIPSVPYLELYLELKKLEKLVDDDCLDRKWLMNLLEEVMDSTFEWMSRNPENWTISSENVSDNCIQFILDTQFLVEMARHGSYLSQNTIDISNNIISRVEASVHSAGLSPIRDLSEEEWPASAAILALQKLQELHTNESLEDEDAGGRDEDLGHSNPVEDFEQVLTTQDCEIEQVNILAE